MENVGFLDKIFESGSMVFVVVVKLRDGSGGLVRVFVMVDEGKD